MAPAAAISVHNCPVIAVCSSTLSGWRNAFSAKDSRYSCTHALSDGSRPARGERGRVLGHVAHRRLRQAIDFPEQAVADADVTADGRELALRERRGLLVARDRRGRAGPEQRRVRVPELMLGQAHDALGGDDGRAHAGGRATAASARRPTRSRPPAAYRQQGAEQAGAAQQPSSLNVGRTLALHEDPPPPSCASE